MIATQPSVMYTEVTQPLGGTYQAHSSTMPTRAPSQTAPNTSARTQPDIASSDMGVAVPAIIR